MMGKMTEGWPLCAVNRPKPATETVEIRIGEVKTRMRREDFCKRPKTAISGQRRP